MKRDETVNWSVYSRIRADPKVAYPKDLRILILVFFFGTVVARSAEIQDSTLFVDPCTMHLFEAGSGPMGEAFNGRGFFVRECAVDQPPEDNAGFRGRHLFHKDPHPGERVPHTPLETFGGPAPGGGGGGRGRRLPVRRRRHRPRPPHGPRGQATPPPLTPPPPPPMAVIPRRFPDRP